MFDNYLPSIWSDDKTPFDPSFQYSLENGNLDCLEKGTDFFESNPHGELNNIFENPIQIKFIGSEGGKEENEIHKKEEIKISEPSKTTTNVMTRWTEGINRMQPMGADWCIICRKGWTKTIIRF